MAASSGALRRAWAWPRAARKLVGEKVHRHIGIGRKLKKLAASVIDVAAEAHRRIEREVMDANRPARRHLLSTRGRHVFAECSARDTLGASPRRLRHGVVRRDGHLTCIQRPEAFASLTKCAGGRSRGGVRWFERDVLRRSPAAT